MSYMKKLLIVQVAALGWDFWHDRDNRCDFWRTLHVRPLKTVFPALTCPVQASFRTGALLGSHGVVANGFFDRALKKALFWEQSSSICEGPRIWDSFREKGGTVGQMCWQQSLGPDSDLLLSPAPIHKHHGGMIQDFYSRPKDLYPGLCRSLGRKFSLFSYWGPGASEASSRWITDAAVELLRSGEAPGLFLVYLPHLDYDLQRYGPEFDGAGDLFKTVELNLEKLFASAKFAGYEFCVFGDYAIRGVDRAVFPNRALRDAGLFSVRAIKAGKGLFRGGSEMIYPDLYSSKAFALVDHQVAHVYVQGEQSLEQARNRLEKLDGVGRVIGKRETDHERSGGLVLEAEENCWFAYPWWSENEKAPEYATHVDIHNKPGYDPCELFMSMWPPMSVSRDTSKILGSHGRDGDRVLWASTLEAEDNLESIIDASRYIKNLLENRQ